MFFPMFDDCGSMVAGFVRTAVGFGTGHLGATGHVATLGGGSGARKSGLYCIIWYCKAFLGEGSIF